MGKVKFYCLFRIIICEIALKSSDVRFREAKHIYFPLSLASILI